MYSLHSVQQLLRQAHQLVREIPAQKLTRRQEQRRGQITTRMPLHVNAPSQQGRWRRRPSSDTRAHTQTNTQMPLPLLGRRMPHERRHGDCASRKPSVLPNRGAAAAAKSAPSNTRWNASCGGGHRRLRPTKPKRAGLRPRRRGPPRPRASDLVSRRRPEGQQRLPSSLRCLRASMAPRAMPLECLPPSRADLSMQAPGAWVPPPEAGCRARQGAR